MAWRYNGNGTFTFLGPKLLARGLYKFIFHLPLLHFLWNAKIIFELLRRWLWCYTFNFQELKYLCACLGMLLLGDGVTAQPCSAGTDAGQGVGFDLYNMDHGCKPKPCYDLCVAKYPTLDDSCCCDANTCRCIYICWLWTNCLWPLATYIQITE